MSQVDNPCDWIIDRIRSRRPFFSMRFNDGEMIQMFRDKPDGFLAGDDTRLYHEHGDALLVIVDEMAEDLNGLLLGCCCQADPDDALNQKFWALVRARGLDNALWTGGHWPLDGVIDGSTRRMLEALADSGRPVVLAANRNLIDAVWCTGGVGIECPPSDSWQDRDRVHGMCRKHAESGATFVWAAGHGLKPTAWKLWREFPQSSHVDVGHLFDGCFGLKNRGWLERGDGPWYEPYMKDFVPWVRSFIK